MKHTYHPRGIEVVASAKSKVDSRKSRVLSAKWRVASLQPLHFTFYILHFAFPLLLHATFYILPLNSYAQMWNGQDTLYGNEWVNYDQSYYKIPVANDGIYRISGTQLTEQGIPVESIPANRYQLFHLGKEVPLYSSSSNTLSANDYLEFYGLKNRAELDTFLFANAEEDLLNPYFSLFTDTAAYFLTWLPNDGPTERFQEVENDISGNLPEPESWFMHEERVVYSGQFLKRHYSISGTPLYYSHFDRAEGFGSRSTQNFQQDGNTTQTTTLNLDGLVVDGPNSEFRARYACGPNFHRQKIRLGLQDVYEEEFEFNGFTVVHKTIPVNTLLLPDNGQLQVTFQGTYDNRDIQSLAFVSIRYPRAFSLPGETSFVLSLAASSESKYLEIGAFDNGGLPPVLYDLTNRLRLEAVMEDGIPKFLIPPSETDRQLILINQSAGSQPVESITPTSFVDYEELDQSFVIVSHSKLINQSGQSWIQEYANYRASSEGGNFKTIVVDVQQLYDQFAYGINRHSQSIRNFSHFIKKEWPSIEYLFFVGKGREYHNLRRQEDLAASEGINFFVPTFGNPGSDNLLVSDVDLKPPIIPIGRLSATSNEEIRIYLEKIQAFDQSINNPQTIEDRGWMKRIMHLGGGVRPGEQISIKNNLQAMENIISTSSFGGNITGFYKSSTDPIQNSEVSALFEQINEGLAMITFFGHSSPGSFDFNIDNLDNYNNAGKHPLILSLGCYSGNIFTAGQSASERFVFYENKAAIAFGAANGLGEVSTLSAFAQQYYRILGEELYGESIGKVQQAVITYFAESIGDIFMQPLKEQFTLHGDPSIKLYPQTGPDLVVDRGSIQFKPGIINAQLDSFEVTFNIVNLGSYSADTMALSIAQQLPSGERLSLFSTRVNVPSSEQQLSFRLPNQGRAAVGQNTLFIEVDVENEIAESPAPMAEQNNKLARSSGEEGMLFFVVDNTAAPVWPQKYAIVSTEEVLLRASTSNAFAPERKYLFEIDTTQLFNSPLKMRDEITQIGGVINWEPNVNWQDKTVYYWRVSPDSVDTNIGFAWEESSFTYLANSPSGWNQGHYFQLAEDNFSTIQMNEDLRELEFFNEPINVRIENKLYNPSNRPALYYNFEGQAGSVQPWNYLSEGVAVVVSEPLTASFWRNPPSGATFEAGDYGVPTQNSRVFAFRTNTPENRANLIEFLAEVVPDGYFVFVFTILRNENSNFYPEDWALDSVSTGTNLFQVLEEEGAASVRQLETLGSVPYTFMYKKGEGTRNEGIAGTLDGVVNINIFIPRVLTEGSFVSTKIGPASEWGRMLWSVQNDSVMPEDSFFVSLIGVNSMNEDSILVENLTVSDTSLQFINAAEFPYLKIKYQALDPVDRSPVQLDYWRVLYKGLPELAVNPAKYVELEKDSLQQGESFYLKTVLENLSNYEMDSVLVKFTLTDAANNETVEYKRYRQLPEGDTVGISTHYDTRSFSGPYQLIIEANPDQDQPELYHPNNFANTIFTVEKDRINPVLDVTFDGIHILNGDIVSSKPQIVLSLQDENPFLILSDSGIFDIQLTYPDGQVQPIALGSEIAQFFPAQDNQPNRATIELYPELEQDGTYQLRVQGRDESGNISGLFKYEVEFQVFNKNMISNVLNYPNPFTTSTQFVYTLTGEEPTYFKIQILTVSGRVVREIGMEEIGGLKIGTHRTQYAWDGTDEFGDRLANGVYLYRIIAKDFSGNDYETYDNGTSGSFKNGFGKMVILR